MHPLDATAHINLSSLGHNLNTIRTHLKPPTKILAAVKANAYGHGAPQIAHSLSVQGVDFFGVASIDEAFNLRAQGILQPILIFIPQYDNLEDLIDMGVRLPIVDNYSLDSLSQHRHEKKAMVHLKVDTGMHRLGSDHDTSLDLARRISRHPKLELEGIWTHFASADEADQSYTQQQLMRFQKLLASLEQEGIEVPLKHSANSAAIIRQQESHFDMVRPGIALYGYHSSPYIASLEPRLQPVMTVKAVVSFVKRLNAGSKVSYGGHWQADRDTTLATVRFGYADGYPRRLSNLAQVWFQAKPYPIRGNVCMDQFMVDFGDDDIQVGDVVTLFGANSIDAEQLAAHCDTISYELLVGIGPRVRRIYQA